MFKPVPIKLKRGEAVFHHPLAVHGSYENKLVQSPKKQRLDLIVKLPRWF